jgi:hypothetical protein
MRPYYSLFFMKGLLDEKQQELNNLKKQLQSEHHQNALNMAKSLCPLFKSVTDVSLVTFHSMDFVLGNRLQGGNHDQGELFSLSSDSWKIWATYNREMRNYKRVMPLRFKLEKEKAITIARPFEVAYYEEAILPVQLVEPVESRDSYLVKVSDFWAQLEVFLAIYMKYMKDCPDSDAKLVSLDNFAGFFSNLRHSE